MISLLEARIQYLKTFSEPIPFTGKNQSKQISWSEKNELHSYKTDYSPKIRAKRFHKYVTETGLDWDRYKKYPVDKDVKKETVKLNNPRSFQPEGETSRRGRSCKATVGS